VFSAYAPQSIHDKRARPQVVDIIALTCRTMPANACNGVLAGCIAQLKPFQDCLPSSRALVALCTVSGVFARIR